MFTQFYVSGKKRFMRYWNRKHIEGSKPNHFVIDRFLFCFSFQIRKIAGCACAGNAKNVSPASAGKRSRHASRHVRDARVVMHAGIAKQRFPLKSVGGEIVPGIPGACATRNFTYLVRGPLWSSHFFIILRKMWKNMLAYPVFIQLIIL